MKKGKIYGKLLLDLALLVLLSLMYRKNAISMRFHELGGLALCGLFLIHKALNRKWICSVTAGIIQRKAKLNVRWVVDVLLLVSMTAVLVTGLLISKTLPTAIAGTRGLQIWHYFFSAASLALSGIHLGLHGAYLKPTVEQAAPAGNSKKSPRYCAAVRPVLLRQLPSGDNWLYISVYQTLCRYDRSPRGWSP